METLIKKHAYKQLISLKKLNALIAVVLAVCLFVAIFLGFIVNFSSGGSMHDGEAFRDGPRFAPYVYNESTVDISMGYTPSPNIIVLYCTYTVLDSHLNIVDSSIMLHFPFSSDYILSKKLTNLANDNYTLIINAFYANGTIRTPVNSTITIDTTVIRPLLTVISP